MDIDLPSGARRLPRHRAKIEAACAAGMQIDELLAMVVAGSFALDIADEYSDVDLKLVTTDDGFDEVVRRQDEMIAACGTPVARFPAEHVGLPELTIVLYDDLVHVDFLPVRLSELAERNEGLAAKVLWERDGRVGREIDRSTPTHRVLDLEWIERRVWTWFWYLQSKILRGELYEAIDGLAWLRATVLFPLLGATRGKPVAGTRRVEGLLEDLAGDFAASSAGPEPDEVMNALRAMATLYKRLADPLLEAAGIDAASAARAHVGAALDAGLDWTPATDGP